MGKVEFVGKCVLVTHNGKRTLAFGDLHLGYETHLNQGGIMISQGLFKEMMISLETIFSSIGKVDRIIILGDIKHAFGSISSQEWNDGDKLFTYLRVWCEEVLIIKGNHDALIVPYARRLGVQVEDFFIEDGIGYIHGDRDFVQLWDKKITTLIMGHGHPAVILDDGVKVEKYKCFLKGTYKSKEIIIVPSYSVHNEGSDPRDFAIQFLWNFNLKKFEVFIVEGNEVFSFGKLGQL